MMLPLEILALSVSVLAASSKAHLSPVLPESEPQTQFSLDLDWAQLSLPDRQQLPIPQSGYQCYINKYPSTHEWLSWDRLWDINREQVLSSNGGDTYIQHYVEEAILQIAEESDVDARLILAIVMQESKGKAGGRCKQVPRCGIIQGGQVFDDKRPESAILEMLREGLTGSSDRSGLNEHLERESSLYAAIWRHHQDRSRGESSTNGLQYENDVANRLLGWDGRGKGFRECGEQG